MKLLENIWKFFIVFIFTFGVGLSAIGELSVTYPYDCIGICK